MKRYILLIALSIFSLNAIHAEITWTLSDDGTLTISGTEMPNADFFHLPPWHSDRVRIFKVVIENGMANIGQEVFSGCYNLSSVTIPNSVTSIGYAAFKDCSRLTSINIPESVTSIGSDAFKDCSSLTSINIPESVMSIGSGAFHGTGWYENQPDGLVYIGQFLYKYKGTMPDNTNIEIKEGTKEIVDAAFSVCSGLTTITIPNSVTSIGNNAFNGCKSLTSITIPNSVTSIGGSAFYSCI